MEIDVLVPKLKQITECVTLGIICMSHASQSGPTTISGFNGTLIMCLPTKQGLVVMADRIGTGIGTSVDKDFCKIRQIGKFAATMATGANNLEIHQPSGNSTKCVFSFDSSKTAEVSLNHFDLSIGLRQHLPGLAEKLATELAFCTSIAEARELMNLNDGSIFQQLFFNYNKQTQKFEMTRILFFLKDGLNPAISWSIEPAPNEVFDKSFAMRAGEISVIRKLVAGNCFDLEKATFDEVSKYLHSFSAPPRRETTKKKAIDILSKCFVLASANCKQTHKVGKVIDAILISEVAGFKWLMRQEDLSPKKR